MSDPVVSDSEIKALEPTVRRLLGEGKTPGEAWAEAFRLRANKSSLIRREAEALIEAGVPELQAWERAIARGGK